MTKWNATASNLRRMAKKQGILVRKDRARTSSLDHQGGYMLVDGDKNFVIAGERFDLTLEEAVEWLQRTDSKELQIAARVEFLFEAEDLAERYAKTASARIAQGEEPSVVKADVIGEMMAESDETLMPAEYTGKAADEDRLVEVEPYPECVKQHMLRHFRKQLGETGEVVPFAVKKEAKP